MASQSGRVAGGQLRARERVYGPGGRPLTFEARAGWTCLAHVHACARPRARRLRKSKTVAADKVERWSIDRLPWDRASSTRPPAPIRISTPRRHRARARRPSRPCCRRRGDDAARAATNRPSATPDGVLLRRPRRSPVCRLTSMQTPIPRASSPAAGLSPASKSASWVRPARAWRHARWARLSAAPLWL
jgi:hypothetical protein